jgi:hypothetical protein
MLKNITFSAEKDLIKKARDRAKSKNSTLNAEFRRWLEQYVEAPQSYTDLMDLMDQLSYAKAGKKFSRSELNER